MSRSLLVVATTIATAALAPQLPATAQEPAGPSIIVAVPGPHVTGEPANGVRQRTQFIANVLVETHDLDLRTAYGRDVLESRVRTAADMACDRLDAIEPPVGVGAAMNPDSGDCRHLAMRRAEPQMHAAIRASG